MLVGDPESLGLRARVRPGMTGLWQVANRTSNTSVEDMLPFDLDYVRTFSFWRDVLILLRTIPVVIRGTGAF
jgi:lipopolysaccharide/colanic/teichoic acid biosynthesis glycosyltransferase